MKRGYRLKMEMRTMISMPIKESERVQYISKLVGMFRSALPINRAQGGSRGRWTLGSIEF